ncbi:MAG TPA: uroporphyrinogen decarboxylase [Acidimicrobiales bacterium]|nr:uroporphyrinogen decarboxylase [Acidimicrobiales bacterium]
MPLEDSSFLRACRLQPVDTTPVWFMRQAGRSLPEYRALRGERSVLEAVRDPALASELTLQPVRRYGVDAAILFSDIVVPLAAVGVDLDVVPGTGPVIASPIRSAADVARLRPLEPELDVPYVLETVRQLAGELEVPLIGFAGAPFTLACYLVEGGPSRTFVRTKALMHGDEALWFALVERLAQSALAFLSAQVEAGASAVQLFDSWAGALSRRDYERYVLPASRRVLEGLAPLRVPRIHFGVGTAELLDLMAEAGPDVVGVDWRTPLPVAARRIGRPVALQGNLDPALCAAGAGPALAEATRVLEDAAGLPGHVFNLGHGVLPETDPDVLARLVDLVHAHGRGPAGRTDAP